MEQSEDPKQEKRAKVKCSARSCCNARTLQNEQEQTLSLKPQRGSDPLGAVRVLKNTWLRPKIHRTGETGIGVRVKSLGREAQALDVGGGAWTGEGKANVDTLVN